MTTITIDIRNLEAVTRKLEMVERGEYLRPVAENAGLLLVREMKVYPPKPAGSTYRRTDTLKHGWKQKVSGGSGGWLTVIGNRVKYAPYVQDETRQAAVHRGRWQTIQSVAKDKKDELMKFCVAGVRQWLRRV